jgi:hypothetical protein
VIYRCNHDEGEVIGERGLVQRVSATLRGGGAQSWRGYGQGRAAATRELGSEQGVHGSHTGRRRLQQRWNGALQRVNHFNGHACEPSTLQRHHERGSANFRSREPKEIVL